MIPVRTSILPVPVYWYAILVLVSESVSVLSVRVLLILIPSVCSVLPIGWYTGTTSVGLQIPDCIAINVITWCLSVRVRTSISTACKFNKVPQVYLVYTNNAYYASLASCVRFCCVVVIFCHFLFFILSFSFSIFFFPVFFTSISFTVVSSQSAVLCPHQRQGKEQIKTSPPHYWPPDRLLYYLLYTSINHQCGRIYRVYSYVHKCDYRAIHRRGGVECIYFG